MLNIQMLDDKELFEAVGGVNMMNQKLSQLKKEFTAACKRKNMNKIMSILPELQARGEYGWAKETANSYGIYSI